MTARAGDGPGRSASVRYRLVEQRVDDAAAADSELVEDRALGPVVPAAAVSEPAQHRPDGLELAQLALDGLELVLDDASPRMLARTSGLAVRRVQASLPRVPSPDGGFDAVLAPWSIETLADPQAGVHELIRLTRSGGTVCMAFCAALDGVDWGGLCVGTMLRVRGTGRLPPEREVDAALREGGASVVRWPTCRGPARAVIATVGTGP